MLKWMWWRPSSSAAWLPGRHPGRVVVVDQLLDVSQLLVEVLEVGPGVLVLTVTLVPLILHVNSCLYILKHQRVKFCDITQPPCYDIYSPWILRCLSDVVWACSRSGQTACWPGPACCAACGTWRSPGWTRPCIWSSAPCSRWSCKPCNENNNYWGCHLKVGIIDKALDKEMPLSSQYCCVHCSVQRPLDNLLASLG